ncbi:hypothetical protein VaNZ11_003898, partial [Volvox africanus]
LALPTSLSIPLDGYCVSVELAPTGPLSHTALGSNGTSSGAVNGLQVQIAQQMLAFATQQATLLQQALPFMLNLPPARVTDKLRGLLTEVQAKPALEKLMKATGSSEPMAQRVCIEFINRNGKGKVDPAKMLAFYYQHKDTVDFSRPLTVQDLLKHMDIGSCICKIQERLPGIPYQTAELAATLCIADADAAVQLLAASSSAAPSALAGPVFLTTATTSAAAEVFQGTPGDASAKPNAATAQFIVGGKGGGSGAPTAATVVLTPASALAPVGGLGLAGSATAGTSGRVSVDGCSCYGVGGGGAAVEGATPGHGVGVGVGQQPVQQQQQQQQLLHAQVPVQSGSQPITVGPAPLLLQPQQHQQAQAQQQQYPLPVQTHAGQAGYGHATQVQAVQCQTTQGQAGQAGQGQAAPGQLQWVSSSPSGDPLSDAHAGLDIAGELKQFTDRLLQLQREAAGAAGPAGGGSSGATAAAIMLPPSHIDMLSNLVLQSNAAINRYLLERQQLHKELALLRRHKEWADSRISDLIKKACESDKPFAEELRNLREEVKRLRADKEGLEIKCMEVEEALAGLKESVYDKDGAKRQAESRLLEAEARLLVMEAEARGAALREAELQKELQDAQIQLKQSTKRTSALERQRAKLQEERSSEAAAATERSREVDRLTAALRAAEKLARERAEAIEAEREARVKDLRAADLATQTAEAVRISLESELENTRQLLQQLQAHCHELEERAGTLQEERDAAVAAAVAQAEAVDAVRAQAAEARVAEAAARTEAAAARAEAEVVRAATKATAAREEEMQLPLPCAQAQVSSSSGPSEPHLSRSASSVVGAGSSSSGSSGSSGSGSDTTSAAGRGSFSGSTGSANPPTPSTTSKLQTSAAAGASGKAVGITTGGPGLSWVHGQHTTSGPSPSAGANLSAEAGAHPGHISNHTPATSSLWGNGHYCAPDFLGLAATPSSGSSAAISMASVVGLGQPSPPPQQPTPLSQPSPPLQRQQQQVQLQLAGSLGALGVSSGETGGGRQMAGGMPTTQGGLASTGSMSPCPAGPAPAARNGAAFGASSVGAINIGLGMSLGTGSRRLQPGGNGRP